MYYDYIIYIIVMLRGNVLYICLWKIILWYIIFTYIVLLFIEITIFGCCSVYSKCYTFSFRGPLRTSHEILYIAMISNTIGKVLFMSFVYNCRSSFDQQMPILVEH